MASKKKGLTRKVLSAPLKAGAKLARKSVSSPITLGATGAAATAASTYLDKMSNTFFNHTGEDILGNGARTIADTVESTASSLEAAIESDPTILENVIDGAQNLITKGYTVAKDTLGLDNKIISECVNSDAINLATGVAMYAPYIMIGIASLALAKYSLKRYVLENKQRREKLQSFFHNLAEHKIPGTSKIEDIIKNYKVNKHHTKEPLTALRSYLGKTAMVYGLSLMGLSLLHRYYWAQTALVRGASKVANGASTAADFIWPKLSYAAKALYKLPGKLAGYIANDPSLLMRPFQKATSIAAHYLSMITPSQAATMFNVGAASTAGGAAATFGPPICSRVKKLAA